MRDDTERLVQEASQGDIRAVDSLLVRYLPGLRAFVRLRAGPLLITKESSADLVQSVCRDVLENMGRFRYEGETGFKRWLYKTALRKIADRYEYYRAQKRNAGREDHRDPNSADTGDEDLLAACRSFYTPSHHAMAREELARLEQAFDKLTEEQREVIVLARLVGLSRAEIAEEMGKSEGAVRTMLSRALAQLAEILEGDESGENSAGAPGTSG
jgi:RNA polymerase sigma-70 factor (ECF subfamily)